MVLNLGLPPPPPSLNYLQQNQIFFFIKNSYIYGDDYTIYMCVYIQHTLMEIKKGNEDDDDDAKDSKM